MNLKKEFGAYLISGGITTGVNYILYMGLLFFGFSYLAANCAAWVGAVLTAYVLNRRFVFHSRKKLVQEFISFTALRFVTLLIENLLLWLFISRLHILPLPSKLLVSIVTVAGNYIFCKYNIFEKEDICHG